MPVQNPKALECITGFLSTSRLWSFGKLKVKKNTAKKERVNSFGFYALNGKSVYSTKDSSKKEDVVEFLEEIKDENKKKRIVIILDNFSSHRSWKSIKRELSSIFLMRKEEVKRFVEALFYKFSSSLSFANGWIEKFLRPIGIVLG